VGKRAKRRGNGSGEEKTIEREHIKTKKGSYGERRERGGGYEGEKMN